MGFKNINWQKDIKATRDRLNEALKVKYNTLQPMIVSITKSAYRGNVVPVATQYYNAQDILNNRDIIYEFFEFERIQKDVQWFKIMIYGILINEFDTETGMLKLKNDIKLFNPKLKLATISRQIII